MSEESNLEVRPKGGDSSLVVSSPRSSLVARGRRDAAALSAPASVVDIMSALKKSLAKRNQMSETERQADLSEIQRMAAHGDKGAQKNLAWIYYSGSDFYSVTQDYAEAAKWYRKAAEQGDYLAQFEIGEMYRKGKGVPLDSEKAVLWLRKSAEQGFDEAWWTLADMYFFGEGVPQDCVEAANWVRKSAEQGNAVSQAHLGSMYRHGKSVAQDYAEAAKWFRLAAAHFQPALDFGGAEPNFNLGSIYYSGQGVPQDYIEAAKWYRRAADQNHRNAQFNLGVLYEYGHGVPQDSVQAYMWMTLAAATSSDDDKQRYEAARDTVAAKMNAAQIAEAQRLARNWKRS